MTRADARADWRTLTRRACLARGVRLVEWLAVSEVWEDLRYSPSKRSGGYVAGSLAIHRVLGWVWAPTRADALAESPPGTTTVIARASLSTEDRDGWGLLPVGAVRVRVAPLFGPDCVAGRWFAERARARAGELGAGEPFPLTAPLAAA